MVATLDANGQESLGDPVDVVGKFGVCLGLDGAVGLDEMDSRIATPLPSGSCGEIAKP